MKKTYHVLTTLIMEKKNLVTMATSTLIGGPGLVRPHYRKRTIFERL